ncbi:NAD synthetase [Carpediemonas membranifera]|uniref:NAD synthetase n=1 Tax=Carpediemonas membranifera TaxID=201153 RepID=A0A8J6DZP3_9EUKA|nr:NAD synthetase [Carpediemonas membranifera]|eukprot:KAG9393924.1 NAD synthetase [Carpediemonas membranifera]
MVSIATLHPALQQALEEYRKERGFDAKAFVERKCTMFNEYMSQHGLRAAVVSTSGGVDSAVTLGLAAYASKMPDSPIAKVLAIAQPIHSTAKIQNRAYDVAKAFGVEIVTVDQSKVHTEVCGLVQDALGFEGNSFIDGQMRSYMRTPVNFYIAQVLASQGLPAIVLGTGNYDEDGFLLYFSKAGDGCADIQLIADLHKSEVFKVGAELGVPELVLNAPPSADLWDDQTDEAELGCTYDFVELYHWYRSSSEVKQAEWKASLTPEALDVFTKSEEAVVRTHRRNQHKENWPLNINIAEIDPREML